MMERWMPEGMNVEDYYKRFCTHNRYLPYLLTMDALKAWIPGTDFSKWWKQGNFNEQEVRSIMNSRVPRVWQNQIAKTDIGYRLRSKESIQTLVEYYETLQRLERLERGHKFPATRNVGGPYGRSVQNFQRQRGTESQNQGTESHNYSMRNSNTRGIAWPNNPGRYNVNYHPTRRAQQPYFRGGQGRGNLTSSGRPGPRFQSTPGQSQQPFQRPPMQPGRWQQQRQHAPEAYYYEETEQAQTESNEHEQSEETFQFDEGAATTEEELISQWNDAFFSQQDEDTFFDETEMDEAQYGWQNPNNEYYNY